MHLHFSEKSGYLIQYEFKKKISNFEGRKENQKSSII